MSLLSTAYAGSADISPENADALLNQILPDGPLGMVYIPEAIQKRAQPGLVKVVHWLQHDENGVGVEGTIPVGNLVEALLERNEKLAADDQEPDELVLALLYDPASGLDVSLAKEAHAAGIRVINLAAAGDDLVPEGEAPEDEPADTPPFVPDPPKEEPESPATRVRKARDAGVAAARRARESADAAADYASTHVQQPAPVSPAAGTITLNFSITLDEAGVGAIAGAIVSAMGAQAQAVVQHTAERLPSDTPSPIGTMGQPGDPAGQPEGTAVYYYDNEKASYRPARGTKRKGEERVYLTPEDVADAKAKGMLG